MNESVTNIPSRHQRTIASIVNKQNISLPLDLEGGRVHQNILIVLVHGRDESENVEGRKQVSYA